MDGATGYMAQGITAWFRMPPWSAKTALITPPPGAGWRDVKQRLAEKGIHVVKVGVFEDQDKIEFRILRSQENAIRVEMLRWHKEAEGQSRMR